MCNLSVAVMMALYTSTPAVDAAPPKKDVERLELAGLPAVNYDSNLGHGFGAIVNLAKFAPGADPYRWRVTTQAFASAKGAPGGGVEIPFQQHYIVVDIPDFLIPDFRVLLTGRFERQINAGYFGIGNASRQQRPEGAFDPESDEYAAAARFHQYDRIYPTARIDVRYGLFGDVEAFGGARLVYNFLNLYPGSNLEADVANADLPVDVVGAERHGQLEGYAGLIYDSRDHEFHPTHGAFHEVSFRAGKLIESPESYGGVNVNLRAYRAVAGDYLVIAGRLMADILLGDAPFYELNLHGGLTPADALAGSRAIRGPPQGRFAGKVKIIGNLELRSKWWSFEMFGQDSSLGTVAFFDTGRVWAELGSRPELDGEGLGLKYGVGGGVRLQWGETFIVRGDTGWSPDGLATFININHIF